MKTIKQIADEIGISKQRVYRFVRHNSISEAHHDTAVMQFDDTAVSIIKSHFTEKDCIINRNSEAHQAVSNDMVVDAVITMLKNELEVKNKQIEELTAALREAQQATNAAQVLHAGTMQKQINEREEKRTIIDRILRRN